VSGPELSYVLGTDRYETVRETVRAVAAQSVADRIELVLVGPPGLAVDDADVAGIGCLRVVAVATLSSLPAAHAAAVQACTAPFVLIGESHAFPDRSCVERVLSTLAEGHVAVTPALRNGNPRTARSWANLMVTYSRWLGGPRRELDVMPTHNGAFRTATLVSLGDRLADLLDYGGGLEVELRRHGGTLLLEPAATLAHLNVARPKGWVADRYLAARLYGAARSRGWSRARRAAYCVGGPLIPVVALGCLLRSDGWAATRPLMPRGTLVAAVVSVVVMAAGEVAGYAAGAGSAPERVLEYELHRARYA
jgi:hypothetical protein